MQKVYDFVYKVIFDGYIPYFDFVKKYVVYVSLASLMIFIDPSLFKDFAEIAWKLLIIILFISPLARLFPKIKLFSKLLILRRPI